MTAKDAPHDGAAKLPAADDLDLDNIVSLSADGCARPGGKSHYTPPASKKSDVSGFDGYDDDAAAAGGSGSAPHKFTDSGIDGLDDDAKGPATIDLISRMRGDDGQDDLPAA